MAMNDKEVNGLLFSPRAKGEEDKGNQEVIALACWKRGDFYMEEGTRSRHKIVKTMCLSLSISYRDETDCRLKLL